MNICTYIYIIILFIIFSPGILFSIPSSSEGGSKNKWIRVSIHAFLFSIVWLFTHKIICSLWDNLFPVKEGATIVVNEKSSTTPEQSEIVPPLPPNKCFKHAESNSQFCVTNRKLDYDNKLHSFCYKYTGGCPWFENLCSEDADCTNKYTYGSSPAYTDTGRDCSQHTGGWAKWSCDNAK